MIDPNKKHLVTFAEAARTSPRRPNITTLWRWRNRGVSGVRLEVVCVGGRTYTSREALARFFERVTLARSGVTDRTTDRREREKRAARHELRTAGIIDEHLSASVGATLRATAATSERTGREKL